MSLCTPDYDDSVTLLSMFLQAIDLPSVTTMYINMDLNANMWAQTFRTATRLQELRIGGNFVSFCAVPVPLTPAALIAPCLFPTLMTLQLDDDGIDDSDDEGAGVILNRVTALVYSLNSRSLHGFRLQKLKIPFELMTQLHYDFLRGCTIARRIEILSPRCMPRS